MKYDLRKPCGNCPDCGNTLCVCKAGKPREFWIELWELDENSGDTEVKNVYVKQPKHWPKKPVLQFHVIEKSAYDFEVAQGNQTVLMFEDALARIDALQKERDEAKAALKKLEGVLKHGGEKLASKTVAFKYMIEERDSLKRELEQARQEAGEYYHRGLNDRGDEVAALKAENEKLKQIIKDHDAKGNDCPDLEGV